MTFKQKVIVNSKEPIALYTAQIERAFSFRGNVHDVNNIQSAIESDPNISETAREFLLGIVDLSFKKEAARLKRKVRKTKRAKKRAKK